MSPWLPVDQAPAIFDAMLSRNIHQLYAASSLGTNLTTQGFLGFKPLALNPEPSAQNPKACDMRQLPTLQ